MDSKLQTHWSELDVIRQLSRSADKPYPGLVKGIGDDCAIIEPNPEEQLIVTTDMLVEDVHFNPSWHPPYELGRKSIAVNISDIAAMGGIPKYIFISLCLPNSTENMWLQNWLDGVESMIQEHACCLAGGDTVRGKKITINVTVIGTVRRNQALLRNSAGIGQSIFVSGWLGTAAAGLLLFQQPGVDELAQSLTSPFKKWHLDPDPELRCGMLLSESGLVTSMQDISDGIATDLAHICAASKIRAIIEESLLPHHPNLPKVADALGCNLTELLVAGGEDYRLVFTVAAGRDKELYKLMKSHGVEVFRIGETVQGGGVFLRSEAEMKEITYGGFEH